MSERILRVGMLGCGTVGAAVIRLLERHRDDIERRAGCRLEHEAELDVLRAVADAPAQIATAAELRAPHRLTHAAQELAARFHRFYTECPVLSDDAELTQARLWLCRGTKQTISNLLELLGVSAPESMERTDAT